MPAFVFPAEAGTHLLTPETDAYGSSDMLPGQTRGWAIREHCAQLFQGCGVTAGVLPAHPDSHGREPLRKI